MLKLEIRGESVTEAVFKGFAAGFGFAIFTILAILGCMYLNT